MINTYDSGLTPPPLPPRPGAQRLPPSRAGTHFWCLSLGFVVQTVVIVALFIYLFQRTDIERNEKSAFHDDLLLLKRLEECDSNSLDMESLTAVGPNTDSGALAQMKVERTDSKSTSQVLLWNHKHSTLRNVDHLALRGMLRIRIPGDYYVYSQVTFSKMNPKIPLLQTIIRQKGQAKLVEEDVLLKAFCSPTSGDVCTSYHGGVFRLEKDQQLYVNVTDLDLVNFDRSATAFGLFLLRPTS
ncbi:tumor necrosis factor ligand superfamily member 6-like [Megalops cyprinoides]|uniref:tumor necrosis factor ligand superfamily member 6-like n=1 Tax=Megalops cyprinoides TaxID=118141 RepID=UPI001863E0AB|nr:tumor necrosis factor ligand superfamily member 6-like [Megalops cyprinoides]